MTSSSSSVDIIILFMAFFIIYDFTIAQLRHADVYVWLKKWINSFLEVSKSGLQVVGN